jgi:hypothetical protein
MGVLQTSEAKTGPSSSSNSIRIGFTFECVWHLPTILVNLTISRVVPWFWNESRDILDSTPLGPVYSLNHRTGENAGRGRGYRRQPDPNPGQFRKYDAAMPLLMH